MATKRTTAGALHGALRGNLRRNRDRRYDEAVERQSKYNEKHGGVNLSEKGAVHSTTCVCKSDAEVKVIECGPKSRKRKAKAA